MIKDGDEVTFMTGSGWGAEAHVGIAMGVTERDVTVRYTDGGRPYAKVVPLGRVVGRAIRWNGRESAMDHLCRVDEALRDQAARAKGQER